MHNLVRTAAVLLVIGVGVYYSQSFQNEQRAVLTQSTWSSNPDIANYADARKVFWRKLYAKQFTTLYCGATYSTMPSNGVNIEHVFPVGWVTNAMGCGTRRQCRYDLLFNRIEADLHNLYPSHTDVNTARKSYRYGMIAGESRAFGRRCDFEVDERQRVVEPRPEVRGDIARAMFYMVAQYPEAKLEIFAKQKTLLEQWHRADPPDAAEKARNDAIEVLQGNRNPFVDSPDVF